MRRTNWMFLLWVLVVGVASAQVYNYFPVPGVTYTQGGGMALGAATGGAKGPGTLNAQNLYVNGVAVGAGAGTVTKVSVVSANGLSGTVATDTTTPAITLAPTFTGIAYSNGSALSAAVAADFPTLNQDTTGNAATATTATTASALAAAPTLCGSGEAAQGILASGDATGCITPYALVNESANTLLAGPTSGTAALPTFRALVAADLPLSAAINWTGDQSWSGTGTYTGANTFTPAAGVGVTINGLSSADALDVNVGDGQYAKITGGSTSGQSDGLEIIAGTNSSDSALDVTNHAGSSTLLQVLGDGTVKIPGTADVYDSAGGGPFTVGYLGTPLNAQGGSYTLTAADRGKTIELTGSSGTVTIPASVFSSGDVVTILAYNGTTAYSISPGSGVTLYWAVGNDTNTGTRTLTSVGLATILCVNATTFVITGSGLT